MPYFSGCNSKNKLVDMLFNELNKTSANSVIMNKLVFK